MQQLLKPPPQILTPFLFQTRVQRISGSGKSSAAPLSEMSILASRVSDLDRPETRFGKKQESHTVAWTLKRAYVDKITLNRPLGDFLKDLKRDFEDLNYKDQDPDCLELVKKWLPLFKKLETATLEEHEWADWTERLGEAYITAYQLSKSATYSHGEPKGNAEGSAMATLRMNEESLERYGTLISEETTIRAAALRLLDALPNTVSLSEPNRQRAINHWAHCLQTVFPNLFANLKLSAEPPQKKKSTPKGYDPSTTIRCWEVDQEVLAEDEVDKETIDDFKTCFTSKHTVVHSFLDSGTLYRIEVEPTTTGEKWEFFPLETGSTGMEVMEDEDEESILPISDTPVLLSRYEAKELKITTAQISDKDRALTRFIQKQESHTVPWVLMRQQMLTVCEGKTVSQALRKIHKLLLEMYSQGDNETALKLIYLAWKPLDSILRAEPPLKMEPNEWKRLLQQAVEGYVKAYQSSNAASYRRGAAKGHGEAAVMKKLRESEEALKGGKKPKLTIKKLAVEAKKLLDVRHNQSLPPPSYAMAINHWMNGLRDAFPLLWKEANDGRDFYEPVLKQKLPKVTARNEDCDTVWDMLKKYENVPLKANEHLGKTEKAILGGETPDKEALVETALGLLDSFVKSDTEPQAYALTVYNWQDHLNKHFPNTAKYIGPELMKALNEREYDEDDDCDTIGDLLAKYPRK